MILLNKPQGLTPLEAITLLKKQQPVYATETVSYAGRLDPMAEGLMILLVGDENKQRHDYEEFPKTYEFEVVLGVATDTYDLLGRPNPQSPSSSKFSLSSLPQMLETMLPKYLGTQQQPYPPYSSKPVNGKPLYWWARQGKISEITIPTKEIIITSLSLVSTTSLSGSELHQAVNERIQKVSGDFRQEEILLSWQSFFNSPPLQSFPLPRFEITCSSGTYVRSIANALGEKLGTGALAYSIKRTAVGDFSLKEALQLEPIA